MVLNHCLDLYFLTLVWFYIFQKITFIILSYFYVGSSSYKMEQSWKTLCVTGVNCGWNLFLQIQRRLFMGIIYFTVIDILYKIVQQKTSPSLKKKPWWPLSSKMWKTSAFSPFCSRQKSVKASSAVKTLRNCILKKLIIWWAISPVQVLFRNTHLQ